MKILRYFFPIIIHMLVFLLLILYHTNINLISYLALMILPIVLSSLLCGFIEKKYKLASNCIYVALIHTGFYLFFYTGALFYLKSRNALQYIYLNSQNLLGDSISIGNEISLSLSDAVLPACLCFLLHLLLLRVFTKEYTNNRI